MTESKPSEMRDELQKEIPWLTPYLMHPECRYCLFPMRYSVSGDGRVQVKGLHDNTCPMGADADTDIDVTDITGSMGVSSWEEP
jgi:hypothetical protein